MCDFDSQCRITRVVDGADDDVQLAQLQLVKQRIEAALCNVPAAERVYLGNALLNLAVGKICSHARIHHGDLMSCIGDAAAVKAITQRLVTVDVAITSDVPDANAMQGALHG